MRDLPPGLSGYVAGQQQNNRNDEINMREAQTTIGMLGALQKQKQENEVRAALASGDMGALARTPQGIGILSQLAQSQHLQSQNAETDRQNQFFSPENRAQFMTPGTQGDQLDSSLAGPVRPGTAPQFDMRRFAETGASQGIKGSEPLLNHLAQRDQARAQLAQTFQLRQEQFQKDYALAQQRGADRKELAQMQMDARKEMMGLAASLRPQPQEPMLPVKQSDGTVVYMPRSQAAGREVGGRTTDINLGKQVQQLGQAFEKAGLPSTIAVVNQAAAIKPELYEYITGPKSVLPDLAVSPAARAARQDIQKLFNITLKDRSGAAVTNQELERLKKEFGSGVLKTSDQLKTAIDRAKTIVESHYNGIAASYGPGALDGYNNNLESIGGSAFRPGSAALSNDGWTVKEKK